MNQLSKIFFWPQIVEIYRQVLWVFKKDPMICALFIGLALIEFLALIALTLAPVPPFSYILGPLISRLWSDRFLHYPYNFALLPKLLQHAHTVIATLMGTLVSGIVIKKIADLVSGDRKSGSMLQIVPLVLGRYLSLVFAWLLSFVVFLLAKRFILENLPPFFLLQFIVYILLALVVQSLFVYLLPALVLKNMGFIKGLKTGFLFGVKNFPITVCLVFIPMMVVTLYGLIALAIPQLLRFMPELIFVYLTLNIALITIFDLFVTTATTIYFVQNSKDSA